jgi:acylaminoacyl-peptidase
MPRPPTPDDLARLTVPTDPRLSPDGRLVAWTMQTAARALDGYRHAIWVVPTDSSAPPRQLTVGARHDTHARFSPDGRHLAFLSDRRLLVEDDPTAPKDREDGTQIHVLRLEGGEARRLTDLPRGVDEFAWSPDGRSIVAVSASIAATRNEELRRRGRNPAARPGDPPPSDYRFTDRLEYQANGAGFTGDRVPRLWLVDVESGATRRLTNRPTGESAPAWSPDGRRIAFQTNRRADHDIRTRSAVHVLDVESGSETAVTGGADALFFAPAWLPDGTTLAVLGGRGRDAWYRSDVWLFAADGSDGEAGGGRNLSGRHDLMVGSTMAADVQPSEPARVMSDGDGARLTVTAPIDGSIELWRIVTADGTLERLTDDRHYLSAFDQVPLDGGGARVAFLRSTPTAPADVHLLDLAANGVRRESRLTSLHAAVLDEVALVEPIERGVTVDGRQIQGWLVPAAPGQQPLVTEIHGGPHTMYGWALNWEFQVLAAAGMSVFYANPRGSEGYGLAFNTANLRDWGPGPMRDVLGGVDALVADDLADPDRLGLTGGSYGGYLTNWILAHDRRFRAAISCRGVSDMAMLFLTGDISSGVWAEVEFGATPWSDPDYFRAISPLTYADGIRTPLLIQHSERDIRATIGQAEALFTVLRSLRRPVRLMRVPDENHELTRSGTPFRRVENLVQVRDWFAHFLVRGRRGLPPQPRSSRR